jgi:tetratricopeptide (TPR) repeat protein
MILNQLIKLRLASYYNQKAYKACMEESDYFKARMLYEKALEFNPNDDVALFNLDIVKVVS